MISIYGFPRKHLARVLFGDDSPTHVRRIEAMLDGESRMTVDTFWALTRLEPLIDVHKSLRDLYERYEVARWRKTQRAKESKDEDRRLGGDDVAGGAREAGPRTDGAG